MNKTHEKELWEKFREGKEDAASSLYHYYSDVLYRYGKRMTNSEEIIKDSIQDVFIYLLSHRESIGRIENGTFYLIASFRRRLLRTLKKERGFSYDSDDDMTQLGMLHDYSEPIKEKNSIERRTIKILLKSLSSNQQEIVFLKFYCDLSYEEICETMDVSYDYARKMMYRSIKKLRKGYADLKEHRIENHLEIK